MGKSGKKASNIFQNPGIANNNGIVNPKLPGVGSPGKYKPVAKLGPLAAVAGKAILGAVANKAADKMVK